jgi:hypothetical protein
LPSTSSSSVPVPSAFGSHETALVDRDEAALLGEMRAASQVDVLAVLELARDEQLCVGEARYRAGSAPDARRRERGASGRAPRTPSRARLRRLQPPRRRGRTSESAKVPAAP